MFVSSLVLHSSQLGRRVAHQALQCNSQPTATCLLSLRCFLRDFHRGPEHTRGRHRLRASAGAAAPRRPLSRSVATPTEFAPTNVPNLILSSQPRTTNASWSQICRDPYFMQLFVLKLRSQDIATQRFAVVPSVGASPPVDTSLGHNHHQLHEALIVTNSWLTTPYQQMQGQTSGLPQARAPRRSHTRRGNRGYDEQVLPGLRAGASNHDYRDSDDEYDDDEEDDDERFLEELQRLEDEEEEHDDDEGLGYEDDEGVEGDDEEEEEDESKVCFMNMRHVVYGFWTKVPYG